MGWVCHGDRAVRLPLQKQSLLLHNFKKKKFIYKILTVQQDTGLLVVYISNQFLTFHLKNKPANKL